jgi:SPP1 family predicted phage head-tail adaptor
VSENIGEYNRFGTVEQRGAERDALNQPIDDWTPLLDAWAKIRSPSGMSTLKAGNDIDTPINRYSIHLIGYRPAVRPGMRYVSNGVAYRIKQVRPDHANREYTDLVCESND